MIALIEARNKEARETARLGIAAGLCCMAAAGGLAFIIYRINQVAGENVVRSTALIGLLFAVLMVVVLGACALRRLAPQQTAVVAIAAFCVVMTSMYLHAISYYVAYPGDFLRWSESDFVNDIIKFRIGYPIYTAQANNESFTYTPGAPLISYFLSRAVVGNISIPVLRGVQVLYTLGAVFLGFLCVGKIAGLVRPDNTRALPAIWGAFLIPFLFLVATNGITNPFVYNLHNDSLAQLITICALWLLLEYVATRNVRLLVPMALLPAVGFLVKQNLVGWAIFYTGFLLLFDRPRSLRRVAYYAIGVCATVGAAIGSCYLIWGEHFFYWTVQVLSQHGVSPVRSVAHFLQVWPFVLMMIIGSTVLLRCGVSLPLKATWLLSAGILLIQIYTSGIAWMLNHIGPGSLLAGVWFLAAVTAYWPMLAGAEQRWSVENTWRAAVPALCIGLLIAGLGTVQMPSRPFHGDASRYLADIERQFKGLPTDRVLLDAGSWIYSRYGIVMKDRAPCIGERGYSRTGDFSGILGRLRNQYYAKIMVRNYDQPDFWYDHSSWEQPSGIKQALLDNYKEAGKIAAVPQLKGAMESPYLFSEITVLVPKTR